MKKRAAKVLKWAAGVVLIIGLFLALFSGMGNRALNKAYVALEADGRPMKPEELIPAEIPDADNAALIYEAVTLQLQSEKAGEMGFVEEAANLAALIIEGKAEDEGEKRFGEMMSRESVQQAITQLRLATRKKGCRYDLNYSDGAGMLMPHLSSHRNLLRILCAQALTLAADGKDEESWSMTVDALRFADALRNEPTLISQLVRMAQFGIAADTIQRLAKYSIPSKEQHAEIVSLLAGFEGIKPLILAFDGERVLLGEWFFAMSGRELREAAVMSYDDHGPSDLALIGLTMIYSIVKSHDHAAYVNALHKQTMLAGQPYSPEMEAQYDAAVGDVPVYCVMTRMLLPALGRAHKSVFAAFGEARVTRAGLAILSQYESSKKYPDSVEEIKADGLIDPFTNKPLVYRKTDSGFMVYSVGPNATDDGGVDAKKRSEGDIVWRYNRDVR